jgi:peptidoglycan hydrolase-like protein with peptidoglycan-binding domain
MVLAGVMAAGLLPSLSVQADTRDFLTGVGVGIGGAFVLNELSKGKETKASPSAPAQQRQSSAGIAVDPMSRDQTKDLQSRLLFLGYDTGKPDGLSGPATRRAVSAFQRDMGAAVTGVLSPRDIRDLLERTDAYSGEYDDIDLWENDSDEFVEAEAIGVPVNEGLVVEEVAQKEVITASTASWAGDANLDALSLPPELSFALSERLYEPTYIAVDQCATPKGIGTMWESGAGLLTPNTLLMMEICLNEDERYFEADRRISGLLLSTKSDNTLTYEVKGREADNAMVVLSCGEMCEDGRADHRPSHLQIYIHDPSLLHGSDELLTTQHISGYLGTKSEPNFATLDGKYEVVGSVSPELFFGPDGRRESGLVWLEGEMTIKDGVARFDDPGSAYLNSGTKISSFVIDFHDLNKSTLRGYSTNYLIEGYEPETWVNAKADMRQFGAVFSTDYIGIVGLGDTLVEYKDGQVVQGQGSLGLTARRVGD